ncbi:MAG: aldehyde dehydrogenase family protein [Gemmatimonadales bacterium]
MALTRRFPLSPVVGITPFNFPVLLTAHKIAPAMACVSSASRGAPQRGGRSEPRPARNAWSSSSAATPA